MNNNLKIIIIEPSTLVTTGLTSILAECEDFEIIFCCDNLLTGISKVKQLIPDILIINPDMLDLMNRRMIRTSLELPDHTALVGMATTYIDSHSRKNFDGIIDIYDSPQQIIQKQFAAIQNHVENPDSSESYKLSERENEILVSVAKGLPNKEIAEMLNISVNTVISHRKNIQKKTGIKSVSGLTVYALLNNLINQSEVG